MPVPKRYFHCSQEINHDAEMWEFTTTFGDRAIRTWLQILAFLDRSENQWRVSGDWLGTLSRMVRQSSANCSRQVRWMVEKQWLQVGETAADGSPLVFKASNWRKYNRTQEHKGSSLPPGKGADRDPLLSYSFPTPTPSPTPSPKKKKESKICKTASPLAGGETTPVWEAYANAYERRYGSRPVRNARSSGMLKRFLDLVPQDEAPHIAAFFVTHNAQWYVQKMHPVNLLLADAEKLRTEWATNRTVTSSMAMKQDKQAGRGQMYQDVINELAEEKAYERDRQGISGNIGGPGAGVVEGDCQDRLKKAGSIFD